MCNMSKAKGNGGTNKDTLYDLCTLAGWFS